MKYAFQLMNPGVWFLFCIYCAQFIKNWLLLLVSDWVRMAQPLTCSWKEYKCEVLAKKQGYCLKHHARGVLLEEAKKKGVRICDDGKRKCRNETFNNKLKCEECLKGTREKEMAQYNERKEKGLCTMCGKEMEKLTTASNTKMSRLLCYNEKGRR